MNRLNAEGTDAILDAIYDLEMHESEELSYFEARLLELARKHDTLSEE